MTSELELGKNERAVQLLYLGARHAVCDKANPGNHFLKFSVLGCVNFGAGMTACFDRKNSCISASLLQTGLFQGRPLKIRVDSSSFSTLGVYGVPVQQIIWLVQGDAKCLKIFPEHLHSRSSHSLLALSLDERVQYLIIQCS